MAKKEIENKTIKKSVKSASVVKKPAAKKTVVKKSPTIKKVATTTTKSINKETPLKKSASVKKAVAQKDLVSVIIKSMEDKKANNIVCLDLRNVESAVTDYFIICDAQSGTQVEAIGRNIEDEVQKQLNEKPFHSEGYQNAEWILIDYFNVVAHVFTDEKRGFYRLEKLWADAEVKTMS